LYILNMMQPFKLAFAGIFLLIIHYVIISPLFVTKSDLTTIEGKVYAQQLIHVSRPKNVYDAYIIAVGTSPIYFAIQDNNDRAFKYLSTHNIIGKHINVLYDAQGHNEQSNITYHVFSVTVDRNNIMTMNEAKSFYYWGLLLLAFLDLVFVFAYRRVLRKAIEAS
jgi:hypothetical protein